MNIYEAIDLGAAFPRRKDAGKSAPIRSNEDHPDTARERILDQHYGPRRTGTADFDRAEYNREAERIDREYAELRTAERSAAERATAQATLDSLRGSGRGSSQHTAYKRFQR